jgi:hypothetical protein
MIKDSSNLARILKTIYGKLLLRYDYFGVIMGDEGLGKSRGILLNCIEYWYNCLLNKPAPKLALSMNLQQFGSNLEKGERLDMRALDEAGDAMDAQDYANKMNRAIYKAYTVIREKRYFSFVVLPSIFDLNPRFRKRRVKLLINVYKRVNNICKSCHKEFVEWTCPHCGSKEFDKGYVCWEAWNKDKLLEILHRNENREFKSIHVGVRPVTTGIAYEYEGELVSFYDKLKEQKTNDALKDLKREISDVSDGPKTKHCKHLWMYAKKKKIWSCRMCGEEVDKSPFKE